MNAFDDKTKHQRMVDSIRSTIHRIIKKNELQEMVSQHFLQGTFRQIASSDAALVEMLFPGATKNMLISLPNNLKEVLEWNEMFLDLDKIARNALEVLHNIQAKGAKAGDSMDAQTEMVLFPQIGQEALAKGIIEAVKSLNRRLSNVKAQVVLKVASPSAPEAQFDQLDEECVRAFVEGCSLFATQTDFMGEDWTALLMSDVLRFAQQEKMSSIDRDGAPILEGKSGVAETSARIAWIEPSHDNIKESYPALTELLKQLHALPFELNFKRAIFEGGFKDTTSERDGKEVLIEYLQPSAAHFRDGASQSARLDSRDDSGDYDSGIRLTISYHITQQHTQGSGCSLVFHDKAAAETAPLDVVPLVNDLLVMHDSTAVRNSRSAVECIADEYFCVVFFVQGKGRAK